MRFLPLILLLIAAPLAAQDEAIPRVQYLGGISTLPKRLSGILVLSDSGAGLYPCARPGCKRDAEGHYLATTPLLFVPYRQITDVTAETRPQEVTAGQRIFEGKKASDRSDDIVTVTYETSTTAEAAVFKTEPSQSKSVAAKIRFRMKAK